MALLERTTLSFGKKQSWFYKSICLCSSHLFSVFIPWLVIKYLNVSCICFIVAQDFAIFCQNSENSVKIVSLFTHSVCCMIKLMVKLFRFWWIFKTFVIFQVISVKHQMHSFSPQLKSKPTGRLMCEKMYSNFLFDELLLYSHGIIYKNNSDEIIWSCCLQIKLKVVGLLPQNTTGKFSSDYTSWEWRFQVLSGVGENGGIIHKIKIKCLKNSDVILKNNIH